jgi:hypothetical protein
MRTIEQMTAGKYRFGTFASLHVLTVCPDEVSEKRNVLAGHESIQLF